MLPSFWSNLVAGCSSEDLIQKPALATSVAISKGTPAQPPIEWLAANHPSGRERCLDDRETQTVEQD